MCSRFLLAYLQGDDASAFFGGSSTLKPDVVTPKLSLPADLLDPSKAAVARAAGGGSGGDIAQQQPQPSPSTSSERKLRALCAANRNECKRAHARARTLIAKRHANLPH